MSYAALSDVQARAGKISQAWTGSSRPSTGDITGFLANVEAEIDAVIGARGFVYPATGQAASALASLNADGALLLALEATFPETDGPASAVELLRRVRDRYENGMDELRKGTHAATAFLEGGTDAPGSSSFWQDEPQYGLDYAARVRSENPFFAPAVRRGMSF